MKTLRLFLMIGILVLNSISLFSQKYQYKQDAWDKEKVNILDSYGNKVGYYKVDAWDKSKINIYDLSQASTLVYPCKVPYSS